MRSSSGSTGTERDGSTTRATAGALTAALTWGVFGLVAGGGSLTSLVIWAVLGAVCGGLFTYYSVHALPKAQLGRLAEGMHPDSSAIALFTKGDDAEEVLSSVASHDSGRPGGRAGPKIASERGSVPFASKIRLRREVSAWTTSHP